MMTSEQYRKLLSREWVDQQRFRGDNQSTRNEPFIINFTHGESLLNPDIVDILIHTRDVLPDAKIKILSNGTTSPNSIRRGEELLQYVDILGFSMDGYTKETFEAIRTPAKFDKVIDNIRQWAGLREKITSRKMFRFNVALSKMNIHELPDLISLADSLGGFDFIYVQPLLVGDKKHYLEALKLENMNKEEGRGYIEKALERSEKTGIRLIMVDTIKRIFDLEKPIGPLYYETDNRLTQFCTYLWNGLMELNPDGSMREICCNMLDGHNDELMKHYQIPQSGTPFEIYNSKGYWQLRKDLLEGKLLEVCNGCSYGSKDYYYMSETPYDIEIETKDMLKDKVYILRTDITKLKEENVVLRATNVEVSQNNKAIQKRNRELIEENVALHATNVEVSQNNKAIQKRNKELLERNVALSADNADLVLRNKYLVETNESAEERCIQLEKTVFEMQNRNSSLETQILTILNSYSWKVTTPFRWLKSIVRDLK
ncbi:hypothetical protein DSY3309 [Desulfitobacterium hafniense Y51]|uniref:Radical SAM core domain-containing protein n=2 Tax=Desulfitobacterium hafniense TaxID=49338 RepID=Q24S94_DESHY|nr:hypothetical protein DSY3309 [Desulfitobacterium hafniense Y51]